MVAVVVVRPSLVSLVGRTCIDHNGWMLMTGGWEREGRTGWGCCERETNGGNDRMRTKLLVGNKYCETMAGRSGKG